MKFENLIENLTIRLDLKDKEIEYLTIGIY